MMLDNIDRIGAQISANDKIQDTVAPFAHQVDQLCEITGIDQIAARELVGEIGVDMSRFPSAAHLVSWAKFCPQVHESAGKKKNKSRGKGNPWLGGTIGRIVFGFSRSDGFLGARYRRLSKRRGTQKAIVAAGNSMLTIVYHLLFDPASNLATQLQALTGQQIMIRGGKAVINEPNPA
jgi:transposase